MKYPKSVLLLVAICSFLSINAQTEYYIDSIHNQYEEIGQYPEWSNQKFEYDEQKRLTKIKADISTTYYEYADDRRTEAEYSTEDGQFLYKRIYYLNDDGFTILVERYIGEEDLQTLVMVDSLTRDDNNNQITSKSYELENGVLIPSNVTNYKYDTNGNRTHIDEVSYFSGEPSFEFSFDFNYNTSNLLDHRFYRFAALTSSYLYIDTSLYSYTNDILTQRNVKAFVDGEFSRETNYDYEYDGSQTTISESSTTEDGGDFVPRRQTVTQESDSDYLNYESLLIYSYNPSIQDFILDRENYESEEYYSDGDSLLIIRDRTFYFNQEIYDNSLSYEYYFNFDQVNSTEGLSNHKDFKLSPNPASTSSPIDLEAYGEQFDSYKMYNLGGQLIRHEPSSPSNRIMSPRNPGVYFIQLFKGSLPITKLKKIIVQG